MDQPFKENTLGAAAYSSKANCVISRPQNSLAAKIGHSKAPGALAVARVEAALEKLSANFSSWLDDELVKLEAARRAVHTDGMTDEAGQNLYETARALKALEGTFQFPIVTRLATSLCNLIETRDDRAIVPLSLVDAHIDAVRAAVRSNLRGDANLVALALAQELERQVAAYTKFAIR